MPPPCTRRTDSSKHRVRQYTDKLLSIQGAKYRSTSEDNRCKQSSPVKSVNETLGVIVNGLISIYSECYNVERLDDNNK